MVSRSRIEKKLLNLLMDKPLTDKRTLYKYQQRRREFDVLKVKKPLKVKSIVDRIAEAAETLELEFE